MTDPQQLTPEQQSAGPHRWAVGLACATFPLIWVGGLVTTSDAGMAVPDWPTTYGYNLFLYPLREWLLGPWDLFIEHGHRLLGAVVGMITIGLLIVVWRHERRAWVKAFSVLLLVLVVGQGVLGGMRVRLDERALAMVHGCTAPLFFTMCVAMAAVTSRQWCQQSTTNSSVVHRRWLPLAAATAVIAFLQLVVGAQLRHLPVTAQPRVFRLAVYLHLLLAAMVLLHSGWLAIVTRRLRQHRWITRPPMWLLGLVILQFGLGAATWLLKYGPPAWLRDTLGTWDFAIPAASRVQSLVVTGHVATGALIVAVATLASLRLARWTNMASNGRSANRSLMEAAL